MAKLKLIKAKSYYEGIKDGAILATAKNPVVNVPDDEIERLLLTGYFALVESENISADEDKKDETDVSADFEELSGMTVNELRNFAKEKGIDIERLNKKAEILETVSAALGGSFSMMEIQE